MVYRNNIIQNKENLNFPSSFNNRESFLPERGLIFMKISKATVYLFLFFLPLFFLPSNSIFIFKLLEFQKQAFLIFLSLFSGFSWLFYIILSYRFKVKKDLLSFLVLIFVLISSISTLFSNFRYGSIWGDISAPFSPTISLLTVLSFFIFYLVIVNLFSKEELLSLFLTIIVSGFVASILFLTVFFTKPNFSFVLTFERPFNTVGSNNSFALYLVSLMVLLIPLSLVVKNYLKIILAIFGLTFLFVLLLIDFKRAWIALSLGLIFIFVFSAISLKKNRRPVFTTILIFLAMFSFFLTFFHLYSNNVRILSSFPSLTVVSVEDSFNLIPGPRENLRVLSQILNNFNIKELLIGSGPGTFYYNWLKHNYPDINQGSFWSVFLKPSSELFNLITDFGFSAFLVFLLIAFISLKVSFRELLKESEPTDVDQKRINKEKVLLWGITSGSLVFFFLLIFYPTNTSLMALGLVLISSFSLFNPSKQKVVNLYSSPLFTTFGSFIIISILALALGTGFFYGRKFISYIKYQEAMGYFNQSNIEKAEEFISQAIRLNPKLDIFWRDLSQIYLIKIQNFLNQTDLNKEELNIEIANLINQMINSAKEATKLNKINPLNWENLALIYQSLIGKVAKSEDETLKLYEEVKKLEPKNPFIFNITGEIYLLKADYLLLIQDNQGYEENLKLAKANIEKALELKPDYAVAYFNRANIYIKENKIDKAKEDLVRAIFINPNYSNARYSLGMILDKEGDKEGALLQFEIVQQFNPENEEIKKIIANLKDGKPALEGLNYQVPQQDQIQENEKDETINKDKGTENKKDSKP